MADFNDAEVDVDENAAINEIMDKLAAKDYQGVYNLEEEELKKLEEHSDYIDGVDDNALHELLESTYAGIYASLRSSVATDSTVSDYEEDSEIMSPRYVPEEIEHEVYKEMLSIVISQLAEKADVVPNDVINRLLQKGIINKADLEENQDIYINYLSSFIPEVRAFKERSIRSEGLNALQRESTTQYLLRRERSMLDKAKKQKLYCIKQIFLGDKGLCCDCPNCGSIVNLDKIALDYIVFATNTVRKSSIESYMSSRLGSTCSLLPRIHYCEQCSSGVLLSPYDLSLIKVELDKIMKKGANSFAQESATFGKGTACTTGQIPYQMLHKIIEYLFYYDTDSIMTKQVITTEAEDSEEDEINAISVDFTEIKLAAEQFYNKLIGKEIQNEKTPSENSIESLQEEDNSISNTNRTFSSLTYHELAIYIANNLSKDYNRLKRQALFSFVFMINETKMVKDLIEIEQLVTLQNLQKFLEGLPEKADNLSASDKIEVINEVLRRYPDKKDVTLQEKLDLLLALKEELTTKIEQQNAFQIQFFDYLKRNIDILAYTKIINLNQYKLADMVSVLNSPAVQEFIDELTDRMIINNLAEDYYQIYVRSGVFNATQLKTITNLAKTESVYERLQNMYYKVITDYYDKAGHNNARIDSDAISFELFKVAELSSNGLKPVRELYDSFRNNDYYRFIEAIDLLTSVDSDILTKDFIKSLKSLLDFADDEIKQVTSVSYLEYYLKDFSTEEIDTADMNTKMLLSRLTFGLYIPKREDEESLADYVLRYTELKKTGKLCDVNHYSFLDKFLKFQDYFGLFVCAGAMDFNYSSYVKASFISVLCTIAAEYTDRDFAIYLFALNEHMISRLLHNSESFSGDMDLSVLIENIRIFQGYYSNFISDYVDKGCDEFNVLMINSNEEFSKAIKVFSMVDRICEILKIEDNAIIALEAQYLESSKNDETKEQVNISNIELDAQEIRDTIISEVSEFGDIDLWSRMS